MLRITQPTIVFYLLACLVMVLPQFGFTQATDGSNGSGLDYRFQGAVQSPGVELNQIMGMLQAESGLQMILGEGIQNKKIDFSLENVTVREILDTVLPAQGLDYVITESGAVRIDTAEKISELKQPETELISRTFSPRFISVNQLLAAFEGLKSPNGLIIPDPDSQKIIVKDIPEAIEMMEQVFMQLDVRTETRVYNIKYANVQDIADQLLGVINTEEGELFVNYRNNQIIITDTIDRLNRAEAIINQIDVEIRIEVIPLAFALPEDVLPLAESLLTESGFVDYDPRTSRIIVQDIPSVVEQIMRLIEQIDIPPQQVYIEVDIVQVSNDKSLTFGTSAAFGKDIGLGGNPAAPSIGEATTNNFFSFNPFLATSGSGLTLLDVKEGSYRFQIEAMVQNNEAEVISSPRLLLQDAGIGSFTLGSQEPYSTRQQTSVWGGGGDYYTQQFRDVGTTIDLEVYISEAGYVEMYIYIEDTRPRRVNLSNVGEALAIDGSFIETQVITKSGRSVVLGGIINRSKSRRESGVPILRSIPILGNLFKNKSSSDDKEKMLVFITPTIVNIDDPYDFAQVDNIQKIKDLQSSGATEFIDAPIDERFLDWSNESEYERQAIDEALEEFGMAEEEQPKQQSKTKESVEEQKDNGIIRSSYHTKRFR